MNEAGLRRMLIAALLGVAFAGLSGCSDTDTSKATANLNVERAERAGI